MFLKNKELKILELF